MTFYGGIEGGGTKFVCAVADDQGTILVRERFPTEDPASTIQRAIDFFTRYQTEQNITLAGIGIASFGPVDLNPASEHYGYITTTPKPGWQFADFAGRVQRAFPDIPVGFDTDVNGAALGEQRWGAAQAWDAFIYITVGTGIGGGAMVNGKPIHGLIHPEMGHILLPMRADDPLDRGVCPFHPNCLEGLAAGPAIAARWNAPGETLPADHPAWDLEAYYLAHAIEAMMCVLSPQGIILGGSVMHQQQLFPMVRQKVVDLLNDYLKHDRLKTFEDVIVPPGLGDNAGVMGAIVLAMNAAE
ncbi:MAG: ROK family protein [Anaerolineae bacterium]|nr:ROK family protein [Anaerolineae bacterium]